MVTAEYRKPAANRPAHEPDDSSHVPDDPGPDLTPPIRIPIEAELDLHAFAPRDVPSVVAEYLTAAAQRRDSARSAWCTGGGGACSAGIVQAALDRHPCVEEFRDDTASHLGATLVRLRQP